MKCFSSAICLKPSLIVAKTNAIKLQKQFNAQVHRTAVVSGIPPRASQNRTGPVNGSKMSAGRPCHSATGRTITRFESTPRCSLVRAHQHPCSCVRPQIIMLCQSHQFKIAVNGEHLLEFRHRVQDLNSITQLEVLGDLDLQDIKLW